MLMFNVFSPAEGSSSIFRAADAVCRRRLARARGRVIGVLVAIHLPEPSNEKL
jgi:hypothetical protein